MSLPVFLVFGFVVGLLARAVMPGNQKMGLIATTCLGIAGSFMGGLLGSVAFGNGHWNELRATGLIGSVVGALFLMIAARFLSRR
jgi:uncharacterized membrane protein YeaQ/YmgE (transglycosylase-associated protein family)